MLRLDSFWFSRLIERLDRMKLYSHSATQFRAWVVSLWNEATCKFDENNPRNSI